MDIKDLNKSQLILLAVLLSFITSIATGITTVTLMQQVPASFTAPVNRVVQQTIAKNAAAVFDVSKEVLDEGGQTVEVSAGRGFAVSADGLVAVDGVLVPES